MKGALQIVGALLLFVGVLHLGVTVATMPPAPSASYLVGRYILPAAFITAGVWMLRRGPGKKAD